MGAFTGVKVFAASVDFAGGEKAGVVRVLRRALTVAVVAAAARLLRLSRDGVVERVAHA